MKTTTYILPSFIASYLINGDASGYEKEEIEEIDKFLKEKNISIIDCDLDNEYFSYGNDLNKLGAMVCQYTAVKNTTI